MKQKAGQTRRNDGVSYPHIPSSPLLLEPIERRKVCAGVEVQGDTRRVKGHGRRRGVMEGR